MKLFFSFRRAYKEINTDLGMRYKIYQDFLSSILYQYNCDPSFNRQKAFETTWSIFFITNYEMLPIFCREDVSSIENYRTDREEKLLFYREPSTIYLSSILSMQGKNLKTVNYKILIGSMKK